MPHRIYQTPATAFKNFACTTALLFSLFVLSACGGGGSDVDTTAPTTSQNGVQDVSDSQVIAGKGTKGPNSNKPSNDKKDKEPPPPPPEPAFIKTSGTRWLGPDGTEIDFKGTNLGNWLLFEFWMIGANTDSPPHDQCRMEENLELLFGTAEKERLIKLARDHWITERDWDLMQEFGLNVIRLPFIWSLIEDANQPFTLREDAWHYLDLAINKAKEHGLYVILDLHGAVGGQGYEEHSSCTNQNLYWSTPEFKERTVWLWQQIAQRYKDNKTVAAYGLLNEPWGTNSTELAQEMINLYDAIREIDPNHVIILPGHNSNGIDSYGKPSDMGMTNVAFEMHFYPGLFGWGDRINYQTHQSWLTCGDLPAYHDLCEWTQTMNLVDSPLLVGEFQPWNDQGLEQGAKIARATYDKYAELNWAATNWSWKVLTRRGGQGKGSWGMVTNQAQKLIQSSTSKCAGWDHSFKDACARSETEFVAPSSGTYYLAIKAGNTDSIVSGDGKDGHHIVFDQISLVDVQANVDLIKNGGFDTANDWQVWRIWNSVNTTFGPAAGAPVGSDGTALTLASATPSNGGVYQAVQLEEGKLYRLSGLFKDAGSTSAWAEIYLVDFQPTDFADIDGTTVPNIDFNSPTLQVSDIENLFTSFSTLPYDVHRDLKFWLTTTDKPTMSSALSAPSGLTVDNGAGFQTLSWNTNPENVSGYNVYRSRFSGEQFELIAENVQNTQFVDNTVAPADGFYYAVTAVKGLNESFYSDEVAMD